jgi:hypothetical protein
VDGVTLNSSLHFSVHRRKESEQVLKKGTLCP